MNESAHRHTFPSPKHYSRKSNSHRGTNTMTTIHMREMSVMPVYEW